MSLRLIATRVGLPAELALLQPLSRRSLSLSTPAAARQAPGVYTSPSQETPRLTLNVSGNGPVRSSRDTNGDGMGARSHVGPFPMGVGMDSVVRQGARRPWRELSFGSKGASAGLALPRSLNASLQRGVALADVLYTPTPDLLSCPRRPKVDVAVRRRRRRPPLLRHCNERRDRALLAKLVDRHLWQGRRSAPG
jgi:hypothetical protein